MKDILLAVLNWLASLTLAFFTAKQKVELEHAEEEKESAVNTANRLANRPTDDNGFATRLRKIAERKRQTKL